MTHERENSTGKLLLFMQLVHPMCEPSESCIKNDTRLPYYSNIENWTGKYGNTIGIHGSYGD